MQALECCDGIEKYIIRVPRSNAKIQGNYYALVPRHKQTNFHPAFDYREYFFMLMQNEHFDFSEINSAYTHNHSLEFCNNIISFLHYLREKYSIQTVVFHPRTKSYYISSVWGFVFSSEKLRCVFELKHGWLKDRFTN